MVNSWDRRGPPQVYACKRMLTGQYDGESSHVFFEGLFESLVHSSRQHGEQAGEIGGLHAVAGGIACRVG